MLCSTKIPVSCEYIKVDYLWDKDICFTEITPTNAYICMYCLSLCYYYNIYTHIFGGVIYRMQICYLSDTYDWLFIYIIYTMADASAYRFILQKRYTSPLLLLTKTIIYNVSLWICLILFASMYVMSLADTYTVTFLHILFVTVPFAPLVLSLIC